MIASSGVWTIGMTNPFYTVLVLGKRGGRNMVVAVLFSSNHLDFQRKFAEVQNRCWDTLWWKVLN